MSVSLAEFLTAWNETLPIKITESDIKNPTEHFFRRVLILLLRHLYVDTSCYDSIDSESSNRLRFLRIRLVAQANHFYKIALPGVKQEFCYMDLIQPTHKKVFAILRYLLNYYVFVRHTYDSTIAELKGQVQERDQLQTYKNHLRKETEEAKIAEVNNIKAIKELDAVIPQKKSKIAELLEKEKMLKNEITKLQEEFDRSEMKLMELKNEIASVRNEEVSDQEIESILEAKESVDSQLEEQDQIAFASRQKLRENSGNIDEALAITAKMENLKTAYDMDPQIMKTKKTLVDGLMNEVSNLKANISKTQMEIDSFSHSLKAREKTFERISNNRDEVQQTYARKEVEQKKLLKQKTKLHQQLTSQELSLADKAQKHADEEKLLYKVASNVIKQISRKVFDDNKENQHD